jgi:glutamate dehydrogenase
MTGQLEIDQRNQFLESMTNSVAELVLHNNLRQTQAISLAQHRSDLQHAEYQRFMAWLESSGKLDRELEFLPTDEQLSERINRHKPSWTRPELAVLVCYSKVMLKEALVAADLLSEPFLAASVDRAFPPALVERYPDEVASHQLRQEIVATQLANDMVDRVGFSFFFRQMESTGASAGDVIRAYSIAMSILGLQRLWQEIEEGDLSATVKLDLLHMLIRLTRRTTRWLLRNRRQNLNCSEIIQQFTRPIAAVLEHLPELHEVEWINLWSAEKDSIIKQGVAEPLASRLAASDSMFISLGVVDTALQLDKPVQQVARLYFKLGEMLSLDWFMAQIVALHPENRWQDLARESYVDDLEGQRRRLTASLGCDTGGDDLDSLIAGWQEQQAALIERWKFMIKDLRNGPTPDFAMISVALRELLDLVQASIDGESR